MGLDIVNSPWTACAATVRDLYGPRMATYDARAGFLQIPVVSIPLTIRKDAVRHPCSSRTGPIGYEKHCKLPCRALSMPVRALYGVHVKSYELFDKTIGVQPCQAVRGP